AIRFASQAPPGAWYPCTLEADALRMEGGGALVTAADVLGGEERSGQRQTVRIFDRRLDAYDVSFASREDVSPFCERLGVDLRFGVTPFRSAPLFELRELYSALGLLALVAFASVRMRAPLVAPLAAVVLFVAFVGTPSIVVAGKDGVHVRWLGRRRFFPIREIRHASAGIPGVTIQTGESHFFPRPADPAKRLAARVNEARACARDEGASEIEPRLERAGRPIGDWMRELRGLLREPAYRVAA